LELERLRKKYETILDLRMRRHAGREHARGGAAGLGEDRDVPTLELRALAHEFPGSLRDLDLLHLGEIHDRIEAVVAAELDPGNLKTWMIAELTFYDAMRGALATKAWLKMRRDVDAAMREAFAREVTSLAHAEEATRWQDDLAVVARPPGGRLVPLALARVAREMSITPAEASALVFRYPRPTKSA
jgi:hypothetical protein